MPAGASYRLHKLPGSIMASASRMTFQEALRELQVTTLIVNSDTDDGSLDYKAVQVTSMSHRYSFCEVRCFKI